MSDGFLRYRRKQIAELRPWTPDYDMSRVSVSAEDAKAGSPKQGDMIARNPKNHADQWLVAAAYFADNFEIEVEMVEAYDGEGNRISVEPYSIPDGIEARDATIRLLDDRVKALTARAEAAEAALRESEANRILLDALVSELKAEKQPTLGRFATLLRRATTKVNRATFQGRDGDG